MSDEPVPVSFTVNGAPYDLRLPARRLLSDALRHDLRLTGTHVGCEHGVCGACTVLVDGRPMRSCLLFAVSLDGASITTTEGLRAADGGMGPVQRAFHECHALQCGFCTPGFVTTVAAYLAEHPTPTREEAREAISGNLCRCTGYVNIVSAVERAAELLAAEPPQAESPASPGPAQAEPADGRAGGAAAGQGPAQIEPADGRAGGVAATVDGPGGRREAPDGSGAATPPGSPGARGTGAAISPGSPGAGGTQSAGAGET